MQRFFQCSQHSKIAGDKIVPVGMPVFGWDLNDTYRQTIGSISLSFRSVTLYLSYLKKYILFIYLLINKLYLLYILYLLLFIGIFVRRKKETLQNDTKKNEFLLFKVYKELRAKSYKENKFKYLIKRNVSI